jgi:tight adherence protein B
VIEVLAGAAAFGILLVYEGIVGPPQRSRRSSLTRHVDELVNEAGVRGMTGMRLLWLCAGSALASFIIVAGISSSITVAAALALGAAAVPPTFVASRRRRRRRAFRDAWPDAIATLTASVRTGVALPEACATLVDRAPTELRGGFAAFTSAYRAGNTFRASLERLRFEFADPIADRVAAALSLAQDVGGTDLVRLLRTLGDFVRDDARVRKEIEARWSWTVVAARVAAAAPWFVLLLMSTRPEAAVAYNSPAGVATIGIGVIATVVGYRLMLRAARLPEERRLG